MQPDNPKGSGRQSIKETLRKGLGLRARLRLLPKVLSRGERYLVGGFLGIIAGAILALPITAYFHFTTAVAAPGGTFSEGLLGEPRLINPLLPPATDSDRDLATLVYSSLLKHNDEGKLVPDLAQSYEISSDGLAYTVYLKRGATWHDGAPVTADDVIFTVQIAQNPDYGSSQRISWQGVEVEKIDDYALMFRLKNKYAQFLNNFTLGIIPRHVWEDVKPISFALSELNLKPIGSGPYLFDKFRKDRLGRIISYELKANETYYGGRPKIDRIELKFYASEDELIDAYNRNEVEGLSVISAQNLERLKYRSRLEIRQIKLPRYFGLFFNQNKSAPLANKNVRLALNYATDRTTLINDILSGNGLAVHSPMIGGILDINAAVKTYDFNQEEARKVLSADGWSAPTGPAAADTSGVLVKGSNRLAFKITTSTWPELVTVAERIRDQWKQIGVEVTVESLPITQLQAAIKERDYEILLFGEILSIDPDPFSLWHSSQKRDPGLNLALYDNKTADTLLEEARQTLNLIERAKKYDDFQNVVIEDLPAAFLYSPYYLYGQPEDVKGMRTSIIATPADRFANVGGWYIATKRIWKR